MQKPGQNLTFSDMYKEYLAERENATVVENEYGFAIYKTLENGIYLQDIYVRPQHRRSGAGRSLLHDVEKAALSLGFDFVLGSCDVTANGATVSAKAILGTGFKLQAVDGNMIYFRKDLEKNG